MNRHLRATMVLASLAASAAAIDVERAIPFVADDYAKALGEARAQKLPLFIEAWAPW